jgi:hypothetical protein
LQKQALSLLFEGVANCRPDIRIAPTIAAPQKESFIVSHSPSPLQIATKIHFFLMRELGKGIDVEKMLQHPRYARDVLLVCDACRGTELAELASTYRQVKKLYDRLEAAAQIPGHAPHPTEWSRNTTGFGVSRPMDVDPPAEGNAPQADSRSWLSRLRGR